MAGFDLQPVAGFFAHMPGAMLVFTRISALFLAGPVIGEAYTPVQIKVLLAMAVTAIIYPPLAAHDPQVYALDGVYVILLLKESLVGLSLGFIINLYLQGVRFGGDLLNRYAGFSAAENFNPDTNASTSPLGDLVNYAALLLFLATNGHHFFFAALSRSYSIIPVGGWQLTGAFYDTLITGMNDMSMIAVALSFPVLTAIMAITFVEGVVTRAVPQINIMHISFTAKIVVSLVVLYSGLPAAVAFLGTVLVAMQQIGYAALGSL